MPAWLLALFAALLATSTDELVIGGVLLLLVALAFASHRERCARASSLSRVQGGPRNERRGTCDTA